MGETTYTGVAATIEAALHDAHKKILATEGRDFTVSKVTSWGMQVGGFTGQARFWVEVSEDASAAFRADS